jgi:hypothetical protein
MRALSALLLLALPVLAADPPTHTLKAEDLTLTVYTPDAQDGYYRGSRFDWSGVFSVQFGKHRLFGPWRKHDPLDHDAIVGPCEEFGTTGALGYDDAKPGGSFLKIGVGALVKPEKEEKYSQFKTYKFAEQPAWLVKATEGKTTFEQSAAAGGYGYKYVKTVSVEKGNKVVIAHALENTGKKAITTDHYNHNFFNVDGATVGKDYTLEYGFKPKADVEKERWKEVVKLDGKKLVFTDSLAKGTIYGELSGFGKEKADNRVTMVHTPSGVTVTATGDQPLSGCRTWAIGSALCPEPFMAFDIAPGKSATWTWTYEFSKK